MGDRSGAVAPIERFWYHRTTSKKVYRGSLGKLCLTPELTGFWEISLTLVGEPRNQIGSDSDWNLRTYPLGLIAEDVK
jgi:hypothetical protein